MTIVWTFKGLSKQIWTNFNAILYAIYEKHCDKPKTFTVNHFEAEGVSRSTLFDILKPKEDGISSERQSGSGRPTKIITKSRINQ